MKKVLIITYYWPPAGGPGVQRVVKFVKYLPQLGWQPIILTVKNPSSPTDDNSLISQIPQNCKVYKTDTFEPFNLYKKVTGKKSNEKIPKNILEKRDNEKIIDKFARWIRSNCFIPDARLGWIHNLKKEGMKIIENEKPDIIFSTSPPHSLQIGAKKLAKKSGLKWVADFRDPWSEAYWLQELKQSKLSKNINKRLEKSVLKKSDSISTVSTGVVEMFRQKVDNNYNIIHNGADNISSSKIKTDKFIILFLGSLGKYHQIESLLKAINSLSNDIREKIELKFVGKVFDGYLKIFDKQKGINITISDYLPFNDAMNLAKEASVLFNPIPNSSYSKSMIGAKTYDYLSLKKPILVLSKEGNAIEKILNETESGKCFKLDDDLKIKEFILKYYKIWTEQKFVILDNENKLEKYTAKYNVAKLVKIFDEVLGNKVK